MAVIDNILFRFWQMGWLNLATDAISRQDAITLLEEAESAWLRGDILLFYPVMLNGLKKLPSVQPNLQPTCNQLATDTVSRARAIETVRKAKSIGQAHRMLEQLPSAQSELVRKIYAIGYTGKEGRIYIGGRLFAVRELAQ